MAGRRVQGFENLPTLKERARITQHKAYFKPLINKLGIKPA